MNFEYFLKYVLVASYEEGNINKDFLQTTLF